MNFAFWRRDDNIRRQLASVQSSHKLLQQIVRGIALEQDVNAKMINQLIKRSIDEVRVEARFSFKRVEAQVDAKLAEMETPRYDWNQTAEGIIRRLVAIERQQTLIRDKNFQIEQALLLLVVKLQKGATAGEVTDTSFPL